MSITVVALLTPEPASVDQSCGELVDLRLSVRWRQRLIQICVFADLSAIDEFGLWYHANGEIRGVDLAPILRYQPGRKLPAMFESNR